MNARSETRAKLAALLEAATPGPLELNFWTNGDAPSIETPSAFIVATFPDDAGSDHQEGNANLYFEAVAALPALLADNQRLEAALREMLGEFRNDPNRTDGTQSKDRERIVSNAAEALEETT